VRRHGAPVGDQGLRVCVLGIGVGARGATFSLVQSALRARRVRCELPGAIGGRLLALPRSGGSVARRGHARSGLGRDLL
jgi:hypothetical protein